MRQYDANEMYQDFAEAFKYHRKRLGISREELAKACYISVSAQGKWERGDCAPGLYCLWAIADYMNITIDQLVGRKRGNADG